MEGCQRVGTFGFWSEETGQKRTVEITRNNLYGVFGLRCIRSQDSTTTPNGK